jgi:hypothetical protein
MPGTLPSEGLPFLSDPSGGMSEKFTNESQDVCFSANSYSFLH